MNMPRALRGPTGALRSFDGTGEDLKVENAWLRREVGRLQGLCDQHETTLCRLTRALWQLRQEALAAESEIAELRDGVQPQVEDLEASAIAWRDGGPR